MLRRGPLLLAVLMAATISADAAANLRFYYGFSGLMTGIKSTNHIKVVDESNRILTNWYGQAEVSVSAPCDGTGAVSLLKGIGTEKVTLKPRSSQSTMTITLSDTYGTATTFSTTVSVANPERDSSFRSLVINELMYDTSGEDNLQEWFELYNNTGAVMSLTNMSVVLDDEHAACGAQSSYSFTASSVSIPDDLLVLPADGYLLLVRSIPHFRLDYPYEYEAILNRQGDYARTILFETGTDTDFDLSASGETAYVRTNCATGSMVSLVYYDDAWGGGEDVSLERIDASTDGQLAANWRSSPVPGGTPGRKNGSSAPPISADLEGILRLSGKVVSGYATPVAVGVFAEGALESASLSVLSSTGACVAVISSGFSVGAGTSRTFTFSGRDMGGKNLPAGLYIIRLEGLSGGKAVTSHRIVAVRP